VSFILDISELADFHLTVFKLYMLFLQYESAEALADECPGPNEDDH
jgi:hypothetical protein